MSREISQFQSIIRYKKSISAKYQHNKVDNRNTAAAAAADAPIYLHLL